LKTATQSVALKSYSDQEGSYSIMTVKLSFVRRTLFYDFNFVVPAALITILSISGFYLPAESGEKIGLRKFLIRVH
jgi:nicotinic acetylcholine receptor